MLFVTPWYPLPESPAAGVFIREHARAAALFDDVAVIHLIGRTSQKRRLIELEEIPDEPFPVVRARYRTTKHVGWLVELTAFIKALRKLRARGFEPEVLHANIAWGAAIAALYSRLTGLPMILSEHWSIYLDAHPRPLRGLLALRSRWSLGQATKVLPVSSTLEAAMRRFAPNARYNVVPNVIDCELFQPAATRQPADTVRLVAVGLLSSNKDYPTMLEAVRELVDAGLPIRLEIIGYGDCHAQLAGLIAATRLEDHVQLAGYLPKEEIAERLRRSHVFVHSSQFETFCAGAAEALASGIPVVSTRCGGPERYLTPETGRLVPVGDSHALAAGIRDVIERLDGFDPDWIAAYARSRFAVDVVGGQLHDIYLSSPPTAAGGRSRSQQPRGLPDPVS